MFKKLKKRFNPACLTRSTVCFVLMIPFFGLWAPASWSETLKDAQLLDRALEIIAMQRKDLSIRTDLSDNPYALSVFHRWMKDPVKAPVEAQQRAMNLLRIAEKPSLWFQELAKIGDIDSINAASLKDFKTNQIPRVPRQLKEAINLLLAAINTANIELDDVIKKIPPDKMKLIEEYLQPEACEEGEPEKDNKEMSEMSRRRDAISAVGAVDRGRIAAAGATVIKALAQAREILTDTDKWKEEVKSFSFMTDLGLVEIGGTGPDLHEKDAALIIDLGGQDFYKGKVASGNNGKSSLVLDLDGNDVYLGKERTQGSGIWGIGVLFDLNGDDLYQAGNLSQGAGLFGIGLLFDAKGSDSYQGAEFVQAASSCGWGGLIDLKGEDTYQCRRYGQAYSGVLGISSLCDLKGNDKYISGTNAPDPRETDMNQSFSQGFAFGKRNLAAGGFALLADKTGNDLYQCQYFGQGASYWMGVGILYDENGQDTYIARRYAQGAGIHFSFGALIDAGGSDHAFSWGVSQGCGHDYGIGLFIDEQGNDTHISGWLSMGASEANGVGIFVDNSGDDGYEARSGMAVGRFNSKRRAGGVGLFIDAGGNDRYSKKGADNSVWGLNRWSSGIDEESGGISGINILHVEETSIISDEAEQEKIKEKADLSEALAKAEKMSYPLNIEAILSVASHWGLEKEIPEKAREKLLNLDPEKSVPAIINLLNTHNIMSLIFMGEFFTPHAFNAIPYLIKKASIAEPVAKARAFYYLGQLKDTRTLECCSNALTSSSWKVRSGAIRAVGEILNKERLNILIPMRDACYKALKKDDPDILKSFLSDNEKVKNVLSVLIRANSIEYQTYRQYAEMTPEGEEQKLVEDFIVLVFENMDKMLLLLERWISDLEKSDKFANKLMAYLHDIDPAVRKATAYSLGQMNFQPAIPELLTLLKDPDLWVRDAAALSLALFEDEALSPLVLAMKHEGPAFKILALDILARIKSDQSKKFIEQHLDDVNQDVRRAAGLAINRF